MVSRADLPPVLASACRLLVPSALSRALAGIGSVMVMVLTKHLPS